MKKRNCGRNRSRFLDFRRLEDRRLLASLSNGQEVISNIGIGQQESFDFQVNTAGTAIVSVGEVSGAGEPILIVNDPNGNFVTQSSISSGVGGTVFVDATQTGTYTAVVVDQGNDESVGFRIRALSLPGTQELIAGRDNVLENGEEVVASIPQGTSAVFPFQVDSTGAAIVSVGEVSGAGEPLVLVYDPNGNFVTQSSTSSGVGGTVFVDATQTGTYTAVVVDQGSDEAIGFRIRALSLPGTQELIAGRDSALRNGEEVAASIPQGTSAVFPFQANPSETVTVSVSETAGNGEPIVLIYDSNGNFLVQSSGVATFTPSQSGVYTAIVIDSGSDETTSFRISATGISQIPEPTILGDVNLDGDVNFLDISPFISLLAGSDFLDEADVNRDGSVDFLDISPFISLLASGGSAQVASNLEAPGIPRESTVTSDVIAAEPEISSPDSVVLIPGAESISSAASTIEIPLGTERSDATNTAPEAVVAAQLSLDLTSDSVVSPVADTSQPPVLATTVTEGTPVDTYTAPVAITPDRYSFLDAHSSNLTDFERNRRLVNHRPLIQRSQSSDFSYELLERHPAATVPVEVAFSTAAELFDAHPESLDEVFDLELEVTFAGLIE